MESAAINDKLANDTDANKIGHNSKLNAALNKVCKSFPGKYIPNLSSLVTPAVCIPTQSPPKAKNTLHRINRSASFDIDASAILPFTNSVIP